MSFTQEIHRTVAGTAAKLGVAALMLLGVLAACSDDNNEPGPDPDDEGTSVPVVASWVVDGGVRESQDVRVALHGIRRVDGGSVLDWSVTPLPREGQSAGDRVGQELQVGVEPWMHNGNGLRLVDLVERKVYRPLDNDDRTAAGQEVVGCLCIPWHLVKNDLTVGETRMLQVAFGPLPEELSSIAVANQGSPMIEDVPIAGEGQVLVGPTVDLAESHEASELLTEEQEFTYPVNSPIWEPQQRMAIRVDEVVAREASTSVRLQVRALEDGPGLNRLGSMPLSDLDAVPFGSVLFENVTSGPGIPVSDGVGGSQVLRSWFATVSQKTDEPRNAPEGFRWRECLCSTMQLTGDARLGTSGRTLDLYVPFPALPSDASTVDIVFPDDSLPAFENVPVTRAAALPDFSVEDADDVETWTPDATGNQSAGWTLEEWPTPVPEPASMAAADVTVDVLEEVVTDEVSAQTEDTERVEITLDSTVSFQPDSARLTPAALGTIRRIAADIDEANLDTVLIEGHVAGSDQGSKEFQQRLSQQRADAVRAALEDQVSSSVRFTSVGKGAEEPVAPNDSEENRKRNRRVVVTYEH